MKSMKRYKDIAWFLVKYGQSDFVKSINLDFEIPRQDGAEHTGDAKEFVEDLAKLGPTFIKLGQLLSSQAQFLPPEYIRELAKLQDDAPEMDASIVEKIIADELGVKLTQAFIEFDPKPISAASLGQVHRAVLPSGLEVAVKVQRPDVLDEILTDINLLQTFAEFCENHTEWGYKHHVTEIVHDMRSTILKELDYLKEAQNLKQLRKNLQEFDRLIIPAPIDDYTTSRVLTMEFVQGLKITKLSAVVKLDIDTKILAKQLFKAYLKQILLDGFFHMDPHPGNVYLQIDGEPKLVILDLGMVGVIPEQMQGHLFEYLLAMSEGRGEECVEVLIQIGKTLADFDGYKLRLEVSEIVARHKELTIEQMPIGQIILTIANIAANAGLWLPSQFNTIGKTLLSLDEVGKALAPDFNPNEAIKNEAAELTSQRMQKYSSSTSFYQSLLQTTELARALPKKTLFLLDRLSKNEYTLKLDFPKSVKDMVTAYEKVANRITMGLILASLVIAAALLMDVNTTFQLFGYPGFAMIMFLLAATGAFLLLITIYKNDRNK